MKFGVREICDVVFRAKSKMTVGSKTFYKHEPVIYFDSLKTSTLEGTVTTVYAQGGRGNARLVAWDGEKTVTFTMEDALISPVGLQILAGADLLEASSNNTACIHTTEITDDFDKSGADSTGITITLKAPDNGETKVIKSESGKNYIYVMAMDENGEIISEPFCVGVTAKNNVITIPPEGNDLDIFTNEKSQVAKVLVDYYVEKESGVTQINIKPESLGGNFYVEASTLFRNQNGVDMPAEFIIPNGKVQSNFTFSMASTGDPSTFTFTMDAFPDETRFNPGEKVFATIQVINEGATGAALEERAAKS